MFSKCTFLCILQAVQEDIKTLQENVNNINELCKQLLVEAEPNFGERLLTEVNSLNEKWAQTVKLAQEQNKRLIMALKSSESMYNRIKELTQWLEPIKDDISNKDYSVENPSDLAIKNKKFKVSMFVEFISIKYRVCTVCLELLKI